MKKLFVSILTNLAFVFGVLAQKDERVSLPIDSFHAKLSREAKPQLIDARSAEEFAQNHIEGAVNINALLTDLESRIQALDKQKPVFIYSIAAGRSGALAKDLRSKGFIEVYDLAGGIANWIGSGKPYFSTAKSRLTLAEFKKLVAENRNLLVDIGSRYCGACKKVKPLLDSLRKKHGDALKIVEIELEDSPQLIAELKTVNVFPYIILYNSGEVVLKRGGLNALEPELDAALAKVAK